MLIKSFRILFSTIIVFAVGCSSSTYYIYNPNNNFDVYFSLSNQNHYCTEPVHFIVKLTYTTGEEEEHINVFNEKMDFGVGISRGHNLKQNKLSLKEGKYHLIATTSTNDYKLDVEFEIVRTQWIYLGYNLNDQLELKFSSTPFIFG